MESLEHSVLETILVAHPIPDAALDGRLMEGTTNLEPLEHSVLVGSLDSGLMEGMLSLEPLEQSVLNTMLVAQPMEGITERTRQSVRLWRRNWTMDNRIWNRRRGRC